MKPKSVTLLRREWDDPTEETISRMRDDVRRLEAEYGETVDIEELIAMAERRGLSITAD